MKTPHPEKGGAKWATDGVPPMRAKTPTIRTGFHHPCQTGHRRRRPRHHHRHGYTRRGPARRPTTLIAATVIIAAVIAAAAARSAIIAPAQQASIRRDKGAKRLRSYIFRRRTGPAICGFPAGPRCKRWSPLRRYCSAILPKASFKIDTRCHSVRSLRSPLALSRQVSEVAIFRFTTLPPLPNVRTSGSRPRFPTMITLFTDPAMWPPAVMHRQWCA